MVCIHGFLAVFMMNYEIKFEVLMRLRFIEYVVLWEQELSTKHLCDFFGVKRQQASKDIKYYLEHINSLSLVYDVKKKRYVATPSFEVKLIGHGIDEYLAFLNLNDKSAKRLQLATAFELPLLKPDPNLSLSDSTAVLVSALKTNQYVSIEVRSIEAPEAKRISFLPHTFYQEGSRWWLRGFSMTDGNYLSVRLSEIYDVSLIGGENTVNNKQLDTDWNTQVNVNVVPDPRLTAVQKRIIENQYHMEHGSLLMTVRVCLLPHLLQKLDIDVNVLHPDPLKQKVVIDNLNAIKRWVFKDQTFY